MTPTSNQIPDNLIKSAGRTILFVLNIKKWLILAGLFPSALVLAFNIRGIAGGDAIGVMDALSVLPVIIGGMFLLTIQSGIGFAKLLIDPDIARKRISSIVSITKDQVRLENNLPVEYNGMQTIKEMFPIVQELWDKRDQYQDALKAEDGVVDTIEQAKNAFSASIGLTFLVYPLLVCISFLSLL